MSRNLRYRYTVKVLTPLHIGSGETIPDVAYHVSQSDSSSCFWTLLDLKAAALEWSQRNHRTDFDLHTIAEFARKHRGPFRKYTLPVSASVARALGQRGTGRQGVREQIKLHSKPYLPGSSLKGAIRTAILSAFLSHGDKNKEFAAQLQSSLGDENIPKTHLDDAAEQSVWGSDPHHDPLRGLRIIDCVEVPAEDYLTISEARVMGFDFNPETMEWKLFWEKLGKKDVREHLCKPRDATKSFLETFQPGKTLEGELSLNKFLLTTTKDQLNFQEKAELLSLPELSKACQKKYGALLRQELALYTKLNDESKGQLQKVVTNLSEIHRRSPSEENEFLLQLSWGAGWRAKTVADQIDQPLLVRVNAEERFFQDPEDHQYALADFRILLLRPRDLLSPKTRRLVMDGDTPVWPLGWVKVRLEKLPEH